MVNLQRSEHVLTLENWLLRKLGGKHAASNGLYYTCTVLSCKWKFKAILEMAAKLSSGNALAALV